MSATRERKDIPQSQDVRFNIFIQYTTNHCLHEPDTITPNGQIFAIQSVH